jgi:hypothetical protein
MCRLLFNSRLLSTCVAILLLASANNLNAQQVVVGTPTQNIGDSFFENIGVGFGGRFPGGSFNGPGAAAAPGLPGVNAGGGGNFGFGINGGGFGLGFNVGASQGSSRSAGSITPSVTVPNGGTGSIFSGSQTPFVTSLIPVVGGYGFHVPTPYFPVMQPSVTSPLRGKIQQYYDGLARASGGKSASYSSSLLRSRDLSPSEKLTAKVSAARDSSAAYGDLSVAEIKRRRELRLSTEGEAKQREIAALVERARGAHEAGKTGVARVYLRQAISRAEGKLQRQLSNELRSLGSD